MELHIDVDDPTREDVGALLAVHRSFSLAATPRQFVFVLDAGELADPAVTFFSARRHGDLVGIGALRRLDEAHAELKSMHTVAAFRRQGVGRAMVLHLLAAARRAGYRRVSLETGTTEEYAAARAMYTGLGFRPSPPFGGYENTAYNACMTIELDGAGD